jgi:hypothetical protein
MTARGPIALAVALTALLSAGAFASAGASPGFHFKIKPQEPPRHDFVPVQFEEAGYSIDPYDYEAFPQQPQAIVQTYDDSMKWTPDSKHHCTSSEIAGHTAMEALDICRSSLVGGGGALIRFDPTGNPSDYYDCGGFIGVFNGVRVNHHPTWLMPVSGPWTGAGGKRGTPGCRDAPGPVDPFTSIWHASLSQVDKPDVGTKSVIQPQEIQDPDPGSLAGVVLGFLPDARGGTWKARCDDHNGKLDVTTQFRYPHHTAEWSAHRACR